MLKKKLTPLKGYNVVRSNSGNYLPRKVGQELTDDVFVDGQFTYDDALARCVEEGRRATQLQAYDKDGNKIPYAIYDTDKVVNEPTQPTLQELIKALDKFTQSEVEKAIRGDANIALRRKVKNLSMKLAAASIRTGMEAQGRLPKFKEQDDTHN